MATERVVIDPLTRIEGHLRIELECDDNQIKNAWSESTAALKPLWRGGIPAMCGLLLAVFAVCVLERIRWHR